MNPRFAAVLDEIMSNLERVLQPEADEANEADEADEADDAALGPDEIEHQLRIAQRGGNVSLVQIFEPGENYERGAPNPMPRARAPRPPATRKPRK